MLIGYGSVAALFVVVVAVMERTRRADASFSDYATAGRSFGTWFSTMAFLNTWLPGTLFIAFAGFSASYGVSGFYAMVYGLLAVVVMFFLAQPVFEWGRTHDLRTQADLLGLRYGSTAVRVVAAVIGVLASLPWVILGMQSLALVFEYLSFGRVGGVAAVFVGIAVVGVRQIWTVRFGMRGVIISDMVQGIVAYLVGTLLILGLLFWLLTGGHSVADVPAGAWTIPGPGSASGPLYLGSLIVMGTLGGWCWPDIFARLFTSDSTRTIKRAATQAAPIVFVFTAALTLLAIVASTVPGVSSAPDHVWFIVAGLAGVATLSLAGVCVVAATMGNVAANVQALGSQVANDIVGAIRGRRVDDPRIGQYAVAALTVAAALGAFATVNVTSGLVELAFISYAAVSQLAPALFLGIFWRRGTAAAAVTSMVVGFVVAVVLQYLYPLSIPWLGGLTGGVAALLVNAAIYVVISLTAPMSPDERLRVNVLFDVARGAASASSAVAR